MMSVFDICKTIPKLNEETGKFEMHKVRRGERVESVVGDLKPKRAPAKEGLHNFTPSELLSLRIPALEVNSRISGYQRSHMREHSRKIAVALKEDKVFPVLEVAMDGNGVMYAVDCQHRAIGGVISGVSLLGVIRRLTKDQQKQLFADQKKARTLDRNLTILSGDSVYERYIQAAVMKKLHPWAQIVSYNASSKTRISPVAMLDLLTSYVGNAMGRTISKKTLERWDEAKADELAPLIACFGNKQTNPAAFRPAALRGIGETAMWVFQRNPNPNKEDRDRWLAHMPGFPWEHFLFIRRSPDFTYQLITHWNKRLFTARRINLG